MNQTKLRTECWGQNLLSSTMKCQTKARGQEKVFTICIKKFLSALVAGSFQVSAGLSWMCEVSRGRLQLHLQRRIQKSLLLLSELVKQRVSRAQSLFLPVSTSWRSQRWLGARCSLRVWKCRLRDGEGKWRSTVEADEWIGGTTRQMCVWGGAVCVCSLQVDTPQVSRWGDGVALWTQFLVALWRTEWQQSGFYSQAHTL